MVILKMFFFKFEIKVIKLMGHLGLINSLTDVPSVDN